MGTNASSQLNDLHWMICQLSEDEREQAAQTSYEYRVDPQRAQDEFVLAMARRYLISKSCRERALQSMRKTLEFRQQNELSTLTEPESSYETELRKFLDNRKLYVCGYDKEGRSTYIFKPRLVKTHDLMTTRRAHLWNLEKAIAASKHPDQTVNAVVDFAGFSVANAPPLHVGKDILTVLRHHYVGHVHQIFLLNAPLSFLCVWKLFKQFCGKMTRDKIHFCSSLEKHYEPSQAASWMVAGGTKNRELDVDEYLDLPFNEAFDEE